MKLNDAGQSNGVFELSVNGQPSARKTGLELSRRLQSIRIECRVPRVSSKTAARAGSQRPHTLDTVVVSTKPVGWVVMTRAPRQRCRACARGGRVGFTDAGVVERHLLEKQFNWSAASGAIASGNTLTDRAVTWTSANTSVATVNASGPRDAWRCWQHDDHGVERGQVWRGDRERNADSCGVGRQPPTTATGTVGKTVQLTASLIDAGGQRAHRPSRFVEQFEPGGSPA